MQNRLERENHQVLVNIRPVHLTNKCKLVMKYVHCSIDRGNTGVLVEPASLLYIIVILISNDD